MNDRPDISIRRGTIGDVETLFNIDRLCFAEGLAYDVETFVYHLHDRSSETWVAQLAGKIIGFPIVQLEPRRHAHFITLDVLPEYRGKRIGSALMDHAHDRAKARGASVMVLQVAVNNAVAMEFYTRRGYVRKRLIKGYYEDKTDAWEMTLDLR